MKDIIVKKFLEKIILANVFVKLVIMMTLKTINAKTVKIFVQFALIMKMRIKFYVLNVKKIIKILTIIAIY